MRAAQWLASFCAIAALSPRATSAEIAPGDALNPSGADPTASTDSRGLSHLRTVRHRSPAGLLYPDPLRPPQWFDLGEGWSIRSAIEFGGLWAAGDERETRFGRFADWDDRALVEFVDLTIAHAASGFAGEFAAGRIAADDEHYRVDLGIPGLARLRGSFSGLPRVFANDATSLYEGAGTDVLRLRSPLQPGFVDPVVANADIASALANTGDSTLSIQRNRTRLSLELQALDSLTLFARYGLDESDGERPFGGSILFSFFGSDPARVVETIEPRDHRTHDFAAGLRYRHPAVLANLEYNGSVFRNADASLTWDNPFSLPGLGGSLIERGRFALAPDNERHNIKADASVPLPWKGRLTTTVSWSRMHQDDDLIPPTVNACLPTVISCAVGASGLDLNQWNTVDALARGSADARVDTLLLNTRIALRPVQAWRIQASVRFYDLHNDTRYTALNPQTGEFGYVAEDGAHAALTPLSRSFLPGGPSPVDDFRYRSSPYDYRTLETEFTTDYRVAPRTTLSGRYRHERIDRDGRERDKTREHRARVSVTSRDLRWATLRASYEYRDRNGGHYDTFPNRNDYISSLVSINSPLGIRPSTLAQLRRYDVANRQRHEAKLSANFLPRDDVDLSISARVTDDDYGAQYGLTRERRVQANIDFGFQPSPNANLYAFGHFESRRSRLSGINDNPFAFVGDPNAGGPVFPFANAWTLDTTGNTTGAGTGIRFQIHRNVELDLHYAFIRSVENHSFETAGAGALASGLTEASDLPKLRNENHSLAASVRVTILDHAALRLFYRFERSTISDFSQRGIASPDLLPRSGALFLGHIDRDFVAHVFGLTLQLWF